MGIKVGDKVRVLNGQFANKTGVVVGIIACNKDYSDPYYEVDMDCQVPNKYKCRKTLITPNNVVGGFNAHDFEVIGNVEDEAKEPKFKKGDKVRFKKIYTVVSVDDGQVFIDSAGNHFDEDCLELYTEPTAPTIKVGDRVCCYNILHIKGSKKEDYMGYVASITDMGITIQLDKGGLVLVYHESDLELVQPKEQTEAEKTDTDNIVDDFAKVMEGYRKVFADITDNFDWLRYEADLAKEIALKVANKYSDPKEAAGYAVSVAKAVVENLKKK